MNNLQSISQFLASRRSYPPAILTAPHPTREELQEITTLALRVPDHKKLEPWRLIAIENESLRQISEIIEKNASSFLSGDERKIHKVKSLYENAGLVVALIFSPIESDSVPKWEQHLSVGAVGLSLVNATIVHGYGAAWLTGYLPDDPEILEFLGLQKHERLSGLIHMGTPSSQPPERPRPDVTKKLTFLD